MTNEAEQLGSAQWILERNLHWIAAAEVKAGVVVAVDTAMLGILASAFSSLDVTHRSEWTYVFTIAAGLTLGAAIFCSAMSVFPHVAGPKSSLIFFGRIVRSQAPDYAVAFRNATTMEMIEDCLAQIHRNAEIACDKFKWVRASMGWSFGAIVPWVAALAFLVDK